MGVKGLNAQAFLHLPRNGISLPLQNKLSRRGASLALKNRRKPATRCYAALAQAEGKVVDFYELLNIDDDASIEEIKSAYRYLAKQCHPDFLGDEGHDLCILLNEAYSVLSNPRHRQAYNARLQEQLQDDLDDYTGKPLSKWLANHPMGKAEDPNESRAVFVDESACIGCKQCVWCASATFRIEPTHGRSRVFAQWIDNEDLIQASIDACPVDCIHWVDKEQLPALEHVMQKRMGRTNVGVMMAGQGVSNGDVFALTDRFLKEREARLKERAASRRYTPAQEAARSRAADTIRAQHSGWWGGFADAVNDAWTGVVDAAAGTVGSSDSHANREVGQRRRARRTSISDNRGTIPLERSLVPVRVRDPYRDF
ncbi:probable chaperone protein DnaJ at N-terminal half [Coccomyxa sp. Obi]|nr:probable chaperone protein DnaJ at N-terminal half [Coccomyxa sp. Obi]